MKKERLLQFIGKYHLAGNVESAAWTLENGKLKTQFISDDKEMLGNLEFDEFEIPNFEDAVFGVTPTSRLVKMIGVVGNDVDLSLVKIEVGGEIKYANLIVKDKEVKERQFKNKLAELAIIPKVPTFKEYPKFDFSIELTDAVVDFFIKAKSALDERHSFAFIKKNGKISLVFGYSTINSDVIEESLGIDAPDELDVIAFNSDYAKDILIANKDANKKKVVHVSLKGLSHFEFEGNDFRANYYVVEKDVED
jgi:hypothetical protein